MGVRYKRYFSEEQFSRIEASGIPDLLRRIHVLKVECKMPEYAFDVHIREKSELMIYHGGTCLLTLNFSKYKGDSGKVLFKSPKYGKDKEGDKEFRLFQGEKKINDIDKVATYICDFLAKVVATPQAVHPKFYRNLKEGYWSNRLSIDYGRNWQPGKDWMIIDREVVLGFDNAEEKSSFYKYRLDAQAIKMRMQMDDPKKWGRSGETTKSKCNFGDELDLLAIGSEKQLLCIELKHSSNTSGIYWGPLQASVYRDAYSRQIDYISDGIKKLVRQKVSLGLLPSMAIALLPEGNFSRVEGILAVADVDESLKSSCWDRAIMVNNQLVNPVDILRSPCDVNRLRWVRSDCW